MSKHFDKLLPSDGWLKTCGYTYGFSWSIPQNQCWYKEFCYEWKLVAGDTNFRRNQLKSGADSLSHRKQLVEKNIGKVLVFKQTSTESTGLNIQYQLNFQFTNNNKLGPNVVSVVRFDNGRDVKISPYRFESEIN